MPSMYPGKSNAEWTLIADALAALCRLQFQGGLDGSQVLQAIAANGNGRRMRTNNGINQVFGRAGPYDFVAISEGVGALGNAFNFFRNANHPGLAQQEHYGVNPTFRRLVQEVESDVLPPILPEWVGKKALLVGHSAGGVFAGTLAASLVQKGYGMDITMITFGSPLIGDIRWRTLMREQRGVKWHQVNMRADFVGIIPANRQQNVPDDARLQQIAGREIIVDGPYGYWNDPAYIHLHENGSQCSERQVFVMETESQIRGYGNFVAWGSGGLTSRHRTGNYATGVYNAIVDNDIEGPGTTFAFSNAYLAKLRIDYGTAPGFEGKERE